MFEPIVILPDDIDNASARWYVVRRGELLVTADGSLPVGAEPPGFADQPRLVIGTIDGHPLYAIDIDRGVDAPDGYEFANLRSLYGKIDDENWVLAGRADQVANFVRTHQFCGQCGGPTEDHEKDRAKKCPACGHLAFPRLTPAIITLITNGRELLLAHGAQFPGRFFSTLAGFVEPGESLEEAVHREIMEEVGVKVTDVTYFGSQPWPFPHSLMIGFTATYVSGDIVIQEEEIVEAGWYHPDDLPPCPIGGMSIAGWMIKAHLDGELDTMPADSTTDVGASHGGGLIERAKATTDETPKKSSIWDRTT